MMNLPIKKYIIVGSYALGVRPAKDIDVICYKDDILVESKGDEYSQTFKHNGWTIECLLADKQESFQYMLKEYFEHVDEDTTTSTHHVAPYEFLYAIKAGHIHIPNRSWEKHISDYHILRDRFLADSNWTAFGIKSVQDLIKLHKKSTEDRLGKQRLPRLNGVTKEKFFDDAVVKYIEHDNIHQMVAHKEKPMYSYMQKDPALVECSKDLWDNFPFEDKIHCVMEESYVIALERHIIPTILGKKQPVMNDHDAFKWALMRVCTNLCSGWFRQFSIDNYFTVLNNYNREYRKLLILPNA